jgi:sugar/nucleoside kinase (ribokinase family)
MRGVPFPDDGFSRRIFERMRREGVRMEHGYDPLQPRPGQ